MKRVILLFLIAGHVSAMELTDDQLESAIKSSDALQVQNLLRTTSVDYELANHKDIAKQISRMRLADQSKVNKGDILAGTVCLALGTFCSFLKFLSVPDSNENGQCPPQVELLSAGVALSAGLYAIHRGLTANRSLYYKSLAIEKLLENEMQQPDVSGEIQK